MFTFTISGLVMIILKIFHDKIEEALRPYGYTGNDLCDALLFAELKASDYHVDVPARLRDETAKDYARKSSELKKIFKIIKSFGKDVDVKFVYDLGNSCYKVKPN